MRPSSACSSGRLLARVVARAIEFSRLSCLRVPRNDAARHTAGALRAEHLLAGGRARVRGALAHPRVLQQVPGSFCVVQPLSCTISSRFLLRCTTTQFYNK